MNGKYLSYIQAYLKYSSVELMSCPHNSIAGESNTKTCSMHHKAMEKKATPENAHVLRLTPHSG